MNVDDATQQARQRLDDARKKALDAAEDARIRVRDAQDVAVSTAREAARDAQERARAVADAMPAGLAVRLLSSMVGIPLLLGLVFFEISPAAPGLLFVVALASVSVLGAGEFFRAMRMRHFRPSSILAYIAVFVSHFAAWSVSRSVLEQLLPALLVVLLIGTLIHQVVRRETEPLVNTGVTLLGVFYAGWLMSYLIQLRSFPGFISPSPFPSTPYGAWVVLYVMAMTWTTDAGAYFVGRRFGKHKLAPSLSPNKTIEGSIGGIFFAVLMGLAWGRWINIPIVHCVVLGILCGVLGQIGDLCESAMKRDVGIKDFGGIMPGHGGVLDRFDSLLFTAPVCYYYLVALVVGGK
ncbi:MAG: phosphatidate cytidylyltransferase [Armatimonadaceae bacterium]